jgi:hypothetical protein
MKKLDDYMNSPNIINEPMPLREVHAIRLMIYDETKDMNHSEVTAYYMNSFKEASEKYNLKIAVSPA